MTTTTPTTQIALCQDISKLAPIGHSSLTDTDIISSYIASSGFQYTVNRRMINALNITIVECTANGIGVNFFCKLFIVRTSDNCLLVDEDLPRDTKYSTQVGLNSAYDALCKKMRALPVDAAELNEQLQKVREVLDEAYNGRSNQALWELLQSWKMCNP